MPVFIAYLLFSLCGWATCPVAGDSVQLTPRAVHGQEIRLIAHLLDRQHYKKVQFNDSLSSVVLEAYVKQLDESKTYFFQADIDSFEPYRFALDDYIRRADVTPAFAIYRVFQKRYMDRMAFARTLIARGFDYTVDEYYETDRADLAWVKSETEMDDLWRKIVKNQALSMKLAGKADEAIQEELYKRYDRFTKNVSQFDSEDVFSIYANALTEAYDPHTNYFSPKTSQLFKQSMSLSLEGIGARLQNENDYIKVVDVLPGGPAQKSGKIHADDLIVGVGQGEEGEMVDVIGWRTSDVVELIKGPKGTVVRLRILPAKKGLNGMAEEVALVREKITLEDLAAKKKLVTYSAPDGKGPSRTVGIVSVPSFYMDFEAYEKGDPDYRSTTADVKKLIDELVQEGAEGIVIDLRNNGGGALPEAIDLTGIFIKEGPVVQVKDAAQRVDVVRDRDPQSLYNGPLLTLVNRFSASASEIFAGAIQDYHRGIVAGESTYGKGTVQTIVDLKRFLKTTDPVGKLKFTTQMFYRVTGASAQNKGVIPDIAFPSPYEEGEYGEVTQPSALPWDEVDPVAFRKTASVAKQDIGLLHAAYQYRLAHDAELKKYIKEVEALKETLADTRVSLNERQRKEKMRQDTLASKENQPVDVEEGGPSPPTDPLLELDDEYLREALLLMYDFIGRREEPFLGKN